MVVHAGAPTAASAATITKMSAINARYGTANTTAVPITTTTAPHANE
jgi:hypothetical protein